MTHSCGRKAGYTFLNILVNESIAIYIYSIMFLGYLVNLNECILINIHEHTKD